MTRSHRLTSILIASLALGLGLWRCTSTPIQKAGSCEAKSETIALQGRSLSFPRAGVFVVESHLATTEDRFLVSQDAQSALWREFPQDVTEGMAAHLARSCALAHTLDPTLLPDCSSLYGKAAFFRQWTPPEGGLAGQGSISKKPEPIQEMFSGNMNWAPGSRPPAGEKWIVTRGGKSVVIAMGFETGPRAPELLGGLQPEVVHYLGGLDAVQIGRLVDQSLPYGPVVCQ